MRIELAEKLETNADAKPKDEYKNLSEVEVPEVNQEIVKELVNVYKESFVYLGLLNYFVLDE